uniref:S9 family peptidase n=1 Tax=Nonomuraea pusilla TaxID=46177 RepID=UPI0022A9AE57|nr:DPP IV N-terminal domain-containing protein [Nonomuraea pusilla]
MWTRPTRGGEERPLTRDGEEDRPYGAGAFVPGVLLGKLGIPHLPPAAVWSPDSSRVLTHRTDLRGVRETYLVEAAPADGGAPRPLRQRYAYPGDERMPLAELVVLDVATGEAVLAADEPLPVPLLSPLTTGWAWWAEDGSAAYFLRRSRDLRTLSLHRLDPASGEVRTVVSESGATRVEPGQEPGRPPMVRVLGGGDEVLWYSQRDGWGHLYLYDARTGEPRRQVTSGPWAVQEIVHVDEERRVVRFLAAGLVEEDPYRRTLCSAGLDGGEVVRITGDALDHVVVAAPDGRYVLDAASTTDTPPVSTVRDWDGRVLVELERADVSALREAGWTPPERFRVKAADGVTDVLGLLHLPPDFDPSRRYPVLDHPYPGPHVRRVSPSFDQGFFGCDAEAAAALGFVVMAMDGRGTPGRDKAFHDASFGRLGDAGGLDDHVAALRQLAAARPWMDLDRVGVCEAGNHDNRCYHLWWAETYDGPDPEAYARSSNLGIADRLRGRLLLVHGGMDDNVHPHQTLRLAERLIAADKDFELLIVPGAEHVFLGYEHYVTRRRWDFLVRHLMGAEPPEYRLSPVPPDAGTLAGVFG